MARKFKDFIVHEPVHHKTSIGRINKLNLAPNFDKIEREEDVIITKESMVGLLKKKKEDNK